MSQKDIDSGTMVPGTIIYWKRFPYPDGDNSDKLLFVVSLPRNSVHLLFKTTSRDHGLRSHKEGCQSENGLYFFPKGRFWFRADTWVLLYDCLELPIEQIHGAFAANEAHIMHYLDKPLVAAVINCFKKTDDISKLHLWYLAD